jgi:hypothetical protein
MTGWRHGFFCAFCAFLRPFDLEPRRGTKNAKMNWIAGDDSRYVLAVQINSKSTFIRVGAASVYSHPQSRRAPTPPCSMMDANDPREVWVEASPR